jgi:hypothetical protein
MLNDWAAFFVGLGIIVILFALMAKLQQKPKPKKEPKPRSERMTLVIEGVRSVSFLIFILGGLVGSAAAFGAECLYWLAYGDWPEHWHWMLASYVMPYIAPHPTGYVGLDKIIAQFPTLSLPSQVFVLGLVACALGLLLAFWIAAVSSD